MQTADDLERIESLLTNDTGCDVEIFRSLPSVLRSTAEYIRLLEEVANRGRRLMSGQDKHGQFLRDALAALDAHVQAKQDAEAHLQKPIADRIDKAFQSDNVIPLPARGYDGCL